MPGNELVQSLVRAIDILSLIAEREEGVRLNELTTLTGIGKTTIHNLLRTMRFKGFVCKDRFERYHICLLYTSPSPRDRTRSRMPSSA